MFLLASSFIGTSLSAAAMSGEGIMSSVEEDGSIIIDEYGYLIDNKVLILSSDGKKTSLHQLSLPVRIYFEYEHTKEGPVIKLIKEIPKVIPQ
jgi:hypothetical protein